MLFYILLTWLLASVSLSTAYNYNGHKIYEIYAYDEYEKEVLHTLSKDPKYDFLSLTKILGDPAHVLVKPRDQYHFEETLDYFGIYYEIATENVQKNIENERRMQIFSRSAQHGGIDPITFLNFHRLSDIYAYLDRLAEEFPERVTLELIGKSVENRDIKSITITNGVKSKYKKAILIDAGTHAREWITYEAALYIIHQLVELYNENDNLLKTYDWTIIPVVNPDGFERTYKKNGDRYWRKNRRSVNSSCDDGVDINRNYGYMWGTKGSVGEPCDETYRGKAAFSEPETQAVRSVMLSLKGRANLYVALHSYGRFLLYPWSFTSALPDKWQLMENVTKAGRDAIKKFNGAVYKVGSTTRLMYIAPGSSADYAYAVANISVSFTMELAEKSFTPKLEQIKPFVEEAWIGMKTMAQVVIKAFE